MVLLILCIARLGGAFFFADLDEPPWPGREIIRRRIVRALRFNFLTTGKRQKFSPAFSEKCRKLGLARTDRRKLAKVVEVPSQVKDLFLQLHNFSGAQVGGAETAFRCFELTP